MHDYNIWCLEVLFTRGVIWLSTSPLLTSSGYHTLTFAYAWLNHRQYFCPSPYLASAHGTWLSADLQRTKTSLFLSNYIQLNIVWTASLRPVWEISRLSQRSATNGSEAHSSRKDVAKKFDLTTMFQAWQKRMYCWKNKEETNITIQTYLRTKTEIKNQILIEMGPWRSSTGSCNTRSISVVCATALSTDADCRL